MPAATKNITLQEDKPSLRVTLNRSFSGLGRMDPKISKSPMLTHLAPQDTAGVTRRDGLSSWRVILYVPVGMLSGSWGWELCVASRVEKLDFGTVAPV